MTMLQWNGKNLDKRLFLSIGQSATIQTGGCREYYTVLTKCCVVSPFYMMLLSYVCIALQF